MTLWEFSETPEELVEMLIKADMTQAAIDERNRRQFARLQAYRRFRRTLEPGFRP